MSGSTNQAASGDGGDLRPTTQGTSVSVIIPVAKKEGLVEMCLRSVLSQEFGAPFEVIVVADADDPMADDLEKDFPSVRVVRCRADSGPGGGRNCGIDQAAGRYLAFVDADCVARRDWLTRIVAACRANAGNPVCGCVETSNGWFGLASNLAERGIGRPNKPIPVPAAWGANMCVSRRLLEGGARFAEDIYGAEEVCLLQAVSPRAQVVLDPSAVVLHLKRLRPGESLRRMYQLGRGAGIIRRHLPVRGSFFARHRWLLPVLPVGRLAATAYRVTRCGIREVLAFAALWPAVLCHLLWYTAGFAAGTSARKQAAGAEAGQAPDRMASS